MSSREISIDSIDTVNRKVVQANAILILLTTSAAVELDINTVNSVWAVQDLLADIEETLNAGGGEHA